MGIYCQCRCWGREHPPRHLFLPHSDGVLFIQEGEVCCLVKVAKGCWEETLWPTGDFAALGDLLLEQRAVPICCVNRQTVGQSEGGGVGIGLLLNKYQIITDGGSKA